LRFVRKKPVPGGMTGRACGKSAPSATLPYLLVFGHAGGVAHVLQLVGKPRREFPLVGLGTRLEASYFKVGTLGEPALPYVFDCDDAPSPSSGREASPRVPTCWLGHEA